jgi:hypothetical protein
MKVRDSIDSADTIVLQRENSIHFKQLLDKINELQDSVNAMARSVAKTRIDIPDIIMERLQYRISKLVESEIEKYIERHNRGAYINNIHKDIEYLDETINPDYGR